MEMCTTEIEYKLEKLCRNSLGDVAHQRVRSNLLGNMIAGDRISAS